MTKKSNDEHMEEFNISDAPIKERHHSESSRSGEHHHHHHHHSSGGRRPSDSGKVDENAVNEDLQNVIADYWKDRQKPGFVGYKSSKNEDEEIRVIVRDDSDPRHTFVDRITGKIVEDPVPEEEPLPADGEEAVMEPADGEIVSAVTNAEETRAELTDSVEVKPEEADAADSDPTLEIKSVPTSEDVNLSPDGPEETESGTTEIVVKKKRGKKKKKSGPVRVIKWVFAILLLFTLAGSVTFGIMRYVGWKNTNSTNDSGEDISTPDSAITEDGGKTVVYKGVTYLFNEELSTILFIGVDQEEYAEGQVSGEAGQADTVILTVVNQKTGETRMIPISRSTMVAVDQYNTDGSYWKQENVQLAVSFAYGNNTDENCKNVAKAVSRILYGMPVHRYVTMDLSAIPQLNDAVGGVTVECLEDLTNVNEAWTKGAEITLHGRQAEAYVRSRETTITDESQDNNAPRMERQKQYLNNFIHTLLSRMKGDVFVPLRLYREVGDDIYSDVTTSEIVYYTSMLVSKGFNNSILSIEGSVKHNEFTEFYPDDEKLYQMILDTFYERQ